MADLTLVLAEWPSAIPSNEEITTFFYPENELFFACRSGNIYCHPASSMSLRMILSGINCCPIIGLATSHHVTDQPHRLSPTLISLDSSGNLCSWDQMDGRCIMQNPTGLEALSMHQVGGHLIILSANEPVIHIFKAESLELVQTVDVPDLVKQIVHLPSDGFICLLMDATLVRLQFDEMLGRIGSQPEVVYSDLGYVSYIDVYNETLLLVNDDHIVIIKDDNERIEVLASGRLQFALLLSDSRIISCDKDGILFDIDVLNHGHKQILKESIHISALAKGVGANRVVTQQKKLFEFALVNGTLKHSVRSIPSQEQKITSSFLTDSLEHVIIGNKDGTVEVSRLEEFYLKQIEEQFTIILGYSDIKTITSVMLVGSILVVGTKSGRVRFWDLEKSELKEEFRNHSCAITNISAIPRSNTEIFCFAQDGSLSVYQLQPNIKTRRVFLRRIGHSLVSLRWATTMDDFVMLQYSDGSHLVWNLNSGSYEEEQSSGSSGFCELFPLFSNKIDLHKRFEFQPQLSLNIRSCLNSNSQELCKLIAAVLSQTINSKEKSEIARKTVSIGFVGAKNNISLHPASDLWSVSPFLSAMLYLSLFSILNVSKERGVEDLRVLFEEKFAEANVDLVIPSLSSLSKFWIDPNESLQLASRVAIEAVIERLSSNDLKGFIDYWLHFLPNYAENSKWMNRSAIILGILTLKEANLLPDEIKKAIALSLVSQLSGDKKNLFRTAAIELIGSGYEIWKPFIQPLPIFKALFTWLVSSADLTKFSDAKLHSASLATVKTLLQFIRHEKYAIMPFWMNELLLARNASERIQGIALIFEILKSSPEVIQEYLVLMIDHIVRMLDPSVPTMRATIAPHVTGLILEFARVFPVVRFHAESQHILVGSMQEEGTLIMLDFRTATRMFSFEGLNRTATCVAFAPDGKQICVYSFDEATVRFWAVPSGLMGLLGTVHKPLTTLVVLPEVTELYLSKQQNSADINLVKLEWTDERVLSFVFHDTRINMEIS